MGVLGKVLIVLNILAAGAFFYLATASWKARQEWTAAAFRNQLLIDGLQLETPKSDVPGGFVPFEFRLNDAQRMTQVRKSTLQDAVPAGGDLGGELVTSQHDEIVRLHKKIQGLVGGIDGPVPRRTELLRRLLNFAQSGTERDGLMALLRDLHDPRRTADARAELPLVGRTPAQVAALEALLRVAALKDDIALQNAGLVAPAKKAMADAARAAAHSVPTMDLAPEQRDELVRKLVNALTAVLEANGDSPDPARIAAAKQTLAGAGEGPNAGLMPTVADIAANMLNDRGAVNDARAKLEKLVTDQSQTEGEKQAMAAVVKLIADPQPNPIQLADQAGRGLLDARFEEASIPVAAKHEDKRQGQGKFLDPAEKSARIAHLLYHVDAHLPWDQRAAWHARAQAVLGMHAYVRAADAQANALSTMAQRLKGVIYDEGGRFESEYQALVQRALYLSGQYDDVMSRLADQRKLETDHRQNRDLREAEFLDLDKEHKQVRADAKKALRDLRAEQQTLYDLNTKIRKAQDELFQLEERLRALEARVVARNNRAGQ